jgi:hypothetical protein
MILSALIKKLLVVFVLCVLLCRGLLGAEEPTTYRFEETVNSQTITIELETGAFDPKAHRVKHISISAGYSVDGQRPIGNQGGTKAVSEFKRFDISWNGKRVSLDRVAWSSIFNVPLIAIQPLSSEPAGLAVIPSPDGSSILFYFRPHSGDAEDPEEAWLVIDRKGKWQKFHSNELLH